MNTNKHKINMKYLLIFFLPIFLFSNEIVDKTIALNLSSQVFGPTLEGILITSEKEDINESFCKNISGIEIKNIKIPKGEKFLKKRLEKYFSKPLNEETIFEIKKEIIKYFNDKKHPFISVITPNQDISCGVLQILIIEGKLGNLTVKGNKHFSTKQIVKSVRLKKDRAIIPDLLDQDLYWLNRNPFRNVYAIYTPGEEEETTDVELTVKDKWPIRLYTGMDNIGNDITGNNRFYAGFNIGNLFKKDQIVNYQFTSGANYSYFHAHSLFYTIPLPWRHIAEIIGGYSHVNTSHNVQTVSDNFKTKGFSLQASLRYTIPIRPNKTLLSEFISGFDFKRTNNDLNYSQHGIVAQYANLTQLMMGYNLGFTTNTTKTTFEIEGFWSPGRWISDQSSRIYQEIRPHAKNYYVYTRWASNFNWTFFYNCKFKSFFRGQLATCNLLPSEEYGLGGFDTIRGYKEREFNADQAVILNQEFYLPSFNFMKFFTKKINSTFEILGFFDWGYGAHNTKIQGLKKNTFMYSYGPGIRVSVVPYLTFRTDWGFQLKKFKQGYYKPITQRLHFSLTIGF